MKKSVITCALVFLVCLGLASSVQAEIVDANEEWGIKLDSGQSLTCIAHYIPDVVTIPESLIFTSEPEPTFRYTGGNWDGWQMVLSADNKMVYLYGPRNTNDTGNDNVKWFSYNLFFSWDDEDPNLDPDYPVYIDTAVFNGGFGCDSFAEEFWKGKPGGWPDNWVGPADPYYQGGYTNPAPEPMTICLLGLGAAFLRKSLRCSKAMATGRS